MEELEWPGPAPNVADVSMRLGTDYISGPEEEWRKGSGKRMTEERAGEGGRSGVP